MREVATYDTQGTTPIFVSVKEAARLLGISAWVCYQLLDDDDCPIDSRYQGRRRLVRYDSLIKYAEGLPTERPEAS